MATPYPAPQNVERKWLLVDLEGQTLGRAASEIARILRGKHKTTFTPHVDVGDFVVCVNAEKIRLTGRKKDQKLYHRFTGYLGNMKEATAGELLKSKPETLIATAVRRMLPRTSLGRSAFSKLKVYAGSEHPHLAQAPKAHPLFPAS